MELDLIIGLVGFVLIGFILYLIYLNKAKIMLGKKKTKKNKDVSIMPVKYLEIQFGIQKEKLLSMKIILLLSYINSFIIALVYYVIMKLPLATAWKFAIGFVLLFGLIYAIYEILGRILKKRGF